MQQKVCTGCGLTENELRSSGKLGCEKCYTVFSELVYSMLNKMHMSVEYKGKIPERNGNIISISEKINKLKAKGMKHVEIKAMVVGIPNVGKSTMINSISRKKMAKTADHPGVTKSLQWIKVSPDVALLDTPGVLWPKFEDQEVAYKLALCGSINDNVLPLNDLVIYAIDFINKNKPEMLSERYHIELDEDPHVMLERIAVARHFLDGNGNPDITRTIAIFLNELRDGLLGTISWEKPDENA